MERPQTLTVTALLVALQAAALATAPEAFVVKSRAIAEKALPALPVN